ncbi:hypothetical protein C0992_011319, partial [Termitomyces sp. T32_za158]
MSFTDASMFMASKAAYDSASPNVTIPLSRSSTFIRIFKYLALCSAAITLSSILPTPWSAFHTQNHVSKVPLRQTPSDPASEWRDNVWPLRKQTPWDISTDFPFPRELEYDVTEGTWLRLDVHPKSGDIVFDMLGDLYCLPAVEVEKRGLTKARPILLGVPFDSDPHFSPEGDRLVFRSDAELGVENIWVTVWKGCEAMDLRSDEANEDLRTALKTQKFEEDLLASGIKEDYQRRNNRLVREGRLNGICYISFISYNIFKDYAQLNASPTKPIDGSPTHAST